MQLTLPIVSFMIFMFLPAGKKLFVITTLCFSIVYKIITTGSRLIKKKFGPVPEVKTVEAPVVPIQAQEVLPTPPLSKE